MTSFFFSFFALKREIKMGWKSLLLQEESDFDMLNMDVKETFTFPRLRVLTFE